MLLRFYFADILLLQCECFYNPVPGQYIAGNSRILTFYKVSDLIAKLNGENALFSVGDLNL